MLVLRIKYVHYIFTTESRGWVVSIPALYVEDLVFNCGLVIGYVKSMVFLISFRQLLGYSFKVATLSYPIILSYLI
jgi:hypothetical protein